tara:strand:+ start:959 stop:1153 length:195 start_codon:yes stop_codon:yes gene_type:complete
MLESALNKDNSTSESQLRYLAKKAENERKRDEGFILASSNDTHTTTFTSKGKKPQKLKNEVYEL